MKCNLIDIIANGFKGIIFEDAKDVEFLGRNGQFIQKGMTIMDYDDLEKIELSPITSKDLIGKCFIQVPYKNIRELRDELDRIMGERGIT